MHRMHVPMSPQLQPGGWQQWFSRMLAFPSPDSYKKFIGAAIIFGTATGVGAYTWMSLAKRRVLLGLPEPEQCPPTTEENQIQVGPMSHVSKTRKLKPNYTDRNNNKIEVEAGTLILHQCPRGKRTPSISPYPLKLETFLRVYGIKYVVELNNGNPRPKDAAWLTLDLEDVSDSHQCIGFLSKRYKIDLEKGMDSKDSANVRAYTHLLDNHLAWGISLWRWVYDGGRTVGEIQNMSVAALKLIPQICSTVEKTAYFHGIGKKKPDEVISAMLCDLRALSEFLGNKQYFIGDEPSELDCTAFSILAQILWNMDGSPFEKAIKDDHKNLVEFCWNMRTTFWPDWDDCLEKGMVQKPSI